MNILTRAAKEVRGELTETERETYIPVVLRDTLLPKLISGESRAK